MLSFMFPIKQIDFLILKIKYGGKILKVGHGTKSLGNTGLDRYVMRFRF